MKTCRGAGFTLIELVFLIGTVLLALVIVQNTTTRCKGRSARISCASNLKQIGLAFRMWADEQGDRFPMEITAVKGGTKELALQGLPLASFTIISNELNNPKPLNCPDDEKRSRANNFGQLTAKNISYFLGLDAAKWNPASILTGDRNLRINGQPTYRLVQTTNWSAITWGANIHRQQGNVGLADGSAQQVTDQTLQKHLQASGVATNRFAIP